MFIGRYKQDLNNAQVCGPGHVEFVELVKVYLGHGKWIMYITIYIHVYMCRAHLAQSSPNIFSTPHRQWQSRRT